MSALRGVAAELFDALTDRRYLAIDTEYTPAPDGGVRIISVAVVPIVRGRRERAGELYVEMNPQVPIDPRTTAVHGFTDDDVKRKRPFAYYAPQLLAALSEPDAVLVQHTLVDVAALRAELRRAGAADLPNLPVLDTSTLPRAVGLPSAGRGVVSLETLCALTGVRNAAPHHARGDARATADAFIALLRHVAATATHLTSSQLLAKHARDAHDVTVTRRSARTSAGREPELPAAHLLRHAEPLTHPATPDELDNWLDLALECATLRCPYLEADADLAAPANGLTLITALEPLLARTQEPGQQGTLVGAVLRLVAPSSGPTALRMPQPLSWWTRVRPLIQAGAPCDPARGQCPSCRRGEPCPRDVLKYAVADVATRGRSGALTAEKVKNRLFGKQPDRYINTWPKRHPELAALMTVLVIDFDLARDARSAAHRRLEVAMDKGLHLVEPALALRACDALWLAAEFDTAESIATHVLQQRTTDPAYAALETWLAQCQGARLARTRRVRNIRFPQLARPEGRVNVNPYALVDDTP